MTTFESVAAQLIGRSASVPTPFGCKPLVYADATASGRSLKTIEQYIQRQVLPFYANTHTESSYTGMHTTALREQARAEVAKGLGATDDYAVIFTGSGATAAINKWISLLDIEEDAVIILGPYEHHSNELPWRELGRTIEVVRLDTNGAVDYDHLESILECHGGRQIVASFSAASNVTGIITDVKRVATLVKQAGGVIGIDYAAAAPYIDIAVADANIDAAFVSVHKFPGGPGTPGVLCVKRAFVSDCKPPTVCGGGTVRYVDPQRHWYVSGAERREEAGTPAIVESIRAGLVFATKASLGAKNIEQKEADYTRQAIERFAGNEAINILGGTEAERLSIFSVEIAPKGYRLHYGFVVALLNDLFGIQVRGGCSCAGPYAHHLLNMCSEDADRYEQMTASNQAGMRPGWIRFNLHYLMSEHEVDYILSAIEFVAEHGLKWLANYEFDVACGIWSYRWERKAERPTLGAVSIDAVAETLDVAKIVAAKLTKELAGVQNISVAPSLLCFSSGEQWFVSPEQLEQI